MTKVQDEKIELVGITADKLVLHRVFERYQSEDQMIRYRLTKAFWNHMQQFIRFGDENPDLMEGLDESGIITKALLMYFAANRKLNESRQNSLSIDMYELLQETKNVLSDSQVYDNTLELRQMSGLVLSQVCLLDMESKK
jgi:hypothetical protein